MEGLLIRFQNRLCLGTVSSQGSDNLGPPSPVSMRVAPLMFSAAKALSYGTILVPSRTSSELGEILWDDTLVSSALGGEEACGGVSLSIISGGRSPDDDDS